MGLATLAQVGVRLGNALPPPGKFLDELLQLATETLEARAGLILLVDDATGELRQSVSRGSAGQLGALWGGQAFNEIARIALLSGEPLMRTSRELGWTGHGVEDSAAPETASIFWVPMKSAGESVGVLSVLRNEPASSGESMLHFTLLQLLAVQGAAAVKSTVMHHELMERERLATSLLGATISAQEEERERICLEIHDGVAQTLVAALRHLEAVDGGLEGNPHRVVEMVERSTALVRGSISEVREILGSLRPATLDTLGLVSTLRQELSTLESELGWSTELRAGSMRLSKEMETALYRILHEAITNARKHSETQRLAVRMSLSRKWLTAEVQDWGKGFVEGYRPQTGGPRRSVGLLSMKKRAELLGGSCEIESRIGSGTTVKVRLPLLQIP
ncbi:MAG TPA: GAF domain-containing sensor histidine kinase [Chloroflexota bacterium]|nr:GAF domain-containing sensor histidine kinase [Chloroflexota bacterium]